MEAVGRLGAAAQRHLPGLGDALDDADATVRAAAREALWRVPPRDARFYASAADLERRSKRKSRKVSAFLSLSSPLLFGCFGRPPGAAARPVLSSGANTRNTP